MYHFLICLLLLMPVTINASTLKGVVTASYSSKPIKDVLILVVGTTQRTMTDVNGRFMIENIKLNVFDITSTSYDYSSKTLRDVQIDADSTLNLSLKLDMKCCTKSQNFEIDKFGSRSRNRPRPACGMSFMNLNSLNFPILMKLYHSKNDCTCLLNEKYLMKFNNYLDPKFGFHRGYLYNNMILHIYEDSTNLILTLDNITMKDNYNAVINLEEILKSDKLKDKYIKLDSSLIYYESIK